MATSEAVGVIARVIMRAEASIVIPITAHYGVQVDHDLK